VSPIRSAMTDMQRELLRRKREIVDREPNGRFRPGNNGGRPRGMPNRINRTLRECVLLAGEIVGSDGRGRDGLLGYLTKVARHDPKTYCGLLGRLMPIDLHTRTEAAEPVFRTIEEVDADMQARGLTPDRLVEMAENMAERARERARKDGDGSLN
jgi:hypothetical protein